MTLSPGRFLLGNGPCGGGWPCPFATRPHLELAYGTGAFFVEMVEAGYNPIGIDLSPYMARLAAQRLRRKNYYYALRLSRAKAQALPFPPTTLPMLSPLSPPITCWPPTLSPKFIAFCKSSAEDGQAGRLVVVFEGQLHGPWPLRSLVDWLYEITAQRSLPPARPLHLLNVTGFAARWEIVEQQGVLARLLIAEKQG